MEKSELYESVTQEHVTSINAYRGNSREDYSVRIEMSVPSVVNGLSPCVCSCVVPMSEQQAKYINELIETMIAECAKTSGLTYKG